jgi:hypothetical protein
MRWRLFLEFRFETHVHHPLKAVSEPQFARKRRAMGVDPNGKCCDT